ncbi:MAG: hypothetical protein WAO61_07830 [Solirubrobacterales bacterium]
MNFSSNTQAGAIRATACTLLLAVTIAGALAVSPATRASTRQLSVLEDSARVLSIDRAVQNISLDEIKALDADIVKIPVLWRTIAPNGTGRSKPRVDLSDPGAYPPANWATLDAAILGAQIRGLSVWLMVTVPAPRWAVAKETTPGNGAFNPDAGAYAEFVEALAKRYQSVKYWSLLNEPNLSLFLQPQHKNGVVLSAIHYRKLYRAGRAALAANGHRRDTILFGELLPRAPVPKRINGTVPPVMWLREFFCLDAELKRFSGSEARKRGCNRFQPIETSGFAYHPYTPPAGPLFTDPLPLNATVHHLGRIYTVLDAAYREGRLTRRKLKVFSSEFGFQSRPPDRKAVPLAKVPGFLNISELLTFNDPRVATYSQYQLVDDLQLSGFQSGLRFHSGRKKPGVYAAYKLPLVVLRRTASSVTIWGKRRDVSAGREQVEIQTRVGRSFRTIATVKPDPKSGYFQRLVGTSGAAAKVFRLKSGDIISRTATPVEMPEYAP